VLAVIPLKPFDSAKGRLERALDPPRRARLSRAVAAHAAAACDEAGLEVAVVTADPGAAAWARDLGLEVISEPAGGGLDGAARAGAETALAAGRPWCIVHADLPLLSAADVRHVQEAAAPGTAVLAPSRDGGTNILAGHTPFAFRYGPGSFSRHLAAAAGLRRVVLVRPGTALDLDTPEDLAGVAALPAGRWLLPYLRPGAPP
jgi:2-phospho-L-lactate guanylyltransferase